jgi:uncharacterized protein with HEPN domain
MSRVYLDYLQDMLENAKRAIQFAAGMNYEAFAKDDKTVYAVIRAVEIIGEAASNIPENVRSKYSEIPWRDIKGMRNKLVHRYFGINMEVVWQTIHEDLPMIVETLENILAQELDKS